MSNDIPYPPRAGSEPRTTFISACEALTWIAWGKAKTVDEIHRDGFDSLQRWGHSELGIVLEALDARAAPAPFYSVKEGFFPNHRFSPNGPRQLRAIRARGRKRTGRLLSFADLAAELRGEIEHNQQTQILLQNATADMMEAMRAGRITAFGQARRSNGERNPGATHDPVPVEVLIHPAMTLGLWNQLAVDSEVDLAAWQSRRGMVYDDVRFRTTDVLALWPVEPSAFHLEITPECGRNLILPSRSRPSYDVGGSCIMSDAIARLAYMEEYDGRYYAPPGDHLAENEAVRRRQLDRFYPSNSALPGIPNRTGLDDQAYLAAIEAWKVADDLRWNCAAQRLYDALMAGTIKAFDTDGQPLPAEFWLANDLRSERASGFRFKRADLQRLLFSEFSTAPSLEEREPPPLQPEGLPAYLANDPSAVAAFEALILHATEYKSKEGRLTKRDDAATIVSKKTGYPVRKMRKLYVYLPETLRNPARTARG